VTSRAAGWSSVTLLPEPGMLAEGYGCGVGMSTGVDVSDVIVTRWRRYGKDRLYVTDADSGKLGWHDLLTGMTEITTPALADAVHAAVARWLAQQPAELARPPASPARPGVHPEPADCEPTPPAAESATPPQPEIPQPPAPAPAPAELTAAAATWTDLAAHRAGQLAREQALALKAAAPVRTLLARALRVHTDERAWRIGADGEEKVAARMARLAKKDPRWRCLHSIPVGEKGSDIDHLLIGPGGVYTLNAKHHPNADIWVGGNTFLVNGQRQPYIRNSRHEADRASRLLTAVCGFPVFAAGVVVPVGAAQVTVKNPPADVYVISRSQLTRWLRVKPERLDDTTTAAIFDAARRSTTWLPAQHVPDGSTAGDL
jgi:hypothetical protein